MAEVEMQRCELPKCGICLEDMLDNLVAMRCGHVYHGNCINEWIENKSLCPTCRKRCRVSDMLFINFQIVRSKAGAYEKWTQGLSKEAAADVEQLHSKLLQAFNELEAEQERARLLQEQNESLHAERSTLQEERKALATRVSELEETCNVINAQKMKFKEELELVNKSLGEKAQQVSQLKRENQLMSHTSVILAQISGGKALETVTNIRKTESVEGQARSLYEICLMLLQKFENYKASLIEYRGKVEKGEKRLLELELECRELKMENRALRRGSDQNAKLSQESDKRRKHREVVVPEFSIVKLNAGGESRRDWTKAGEDKWDTVLPQSAKRLKKEGAAILTTQPTISRFFSKAH